jgi:DNA-binding response OmpR family regulator
VRILIVEDDEAVGGVLQDFLRDLGHEPEPVPTAEEALLRLEDRRPDLVLLDFRLPGMSGFDFLRLPLVRGARVPIVVVSGMATEDQARECLRQGALDFLPKPVPFAQLQRLLECFEALALVEKAEAARQPVEPRRSPRARVAFPVRVRQPAGREWETTSVDLGVEAMKVQAAEGPRPGSTATLSFVVPDDHERLEIDSLLTRVDLDGYVFHFLNLADDHLERLRRCVARLTAGPRRPP